MKVKYIINNYTLGAKLRTCPTHKIISQDRIDKGHTVVVFDGLSAHEKQFCDKILAIRGVTLDC